MKNIWQEKYLVSVSVSEGVVSVSNDQVSVSDDEAETPSLVQHRATFLAAWEHLPAIIFPDVAATLKPSPTVSRLSPCVSSTCCSLLSPLSLKRCERNNESYRGIYIPHEKKVCTTLESCESVDEHAMPGMVKAMAHHTGRQGLSQDWEFTSPKNIIRKGWVCKLFACYDSYSINYIFTSFAAQKSSF